MEVVHLLEVVEIEHQQAVEPAQALVVLQSMFDFQFDIAAVRQARQGVTERQLLQFGYSLVEFQLYRGITEDFDGTDNNARAVPYGQGPHRNRRPIPPLLSQIEFRER